MIQFGRTDTQELLLLPLTPEGQPDEAVARARFQWPSTEGPLPLVPYVEIPQPEAVAGKLWVEDEPDWLADRVQSTWKLVDAPAPPARVWQNAELFMAAFTLPEVAAIALSTDPTIAALRLMLATWHSAVHADDARVVMGLDALEAVGILSPERRIHLLSSSQG